MSKYINKHLNKYWLYEKEYIRMNKMKDFIIDSICVKYRISVVTSSICRKLNNKLSKTQHGKYCGPTWNKKIKNKSIRLKNKVKLKKYLGIENDIVYDFKKRTWW
jgi:hypothetical protein